MNVMKKAIILCYAALLTGCAIEPHEMDLKEVISFMIDEESQTRIKGIGPSPGESGVIWKNSTMTTDDNVKIEYTNFVISIDGHASYAATVTYYDALCQSPVFAVAGSMDFSYSTENERRTAKGSFTLSKSDPEQMPIEDIEFDLTLNDMRATGAITANGYDYQWSDEFIRP